jgi:hypothetical protein
VIETSYWTSPWDKQLESKPRFTLENGKCWDYTDCYCTGCGTTFKTDTTKGVGFTGYGYYQHGQWSPFTKPIGQMTGDEKAKICRQALKADGSPCPKEKVDLVCFNAGGFPKPTCTDKCRQQGPSAVRAAQLAAHHPSPGSSVQPSTCDLIASYSFHTR